MGIVIIIVGSLFQLHPGNLRIDTENDGPCKMYLLSNMAILGSNVRFHGCIPVMC